MKDFVFITGNQYKVDYLKAWLGQPVEHHKMELDEIQSLDLQEVVEHKARQAYAAVQRPVLVDDGAFTLDAMGRLPGTYIKWFIQELELQGVADLAHRLVSQGATAKIMYAYYDGQDMRVFPGELHGTVALEPRGTGGFGFAAILIPDGYEVTMAELDAEEFQRISHRAQALKKFKEFYNG